MILYPRDGRLSIWVSSWYCILEMVDCLPYMSVFLILYPRDGRLSIGVSSWYCILELFKEEVFSFSLTSMFCWFLILSDIYVCYVEKLWKFICFHLILMSVMPTNKKLWFLSLVILYLCFLPKKMYR